MEKNERQQAIRKVTLLGTIINIVLSLLKAFFGWVTGSVSLIADAMHSLSDLLTDVIVLIGTALGSKPADENHPYGHGKLETLSTTLIATVLIIAGLLFIIDSIKKIGEPLTNVNAKWIIMAISAFSILIKEWLYRRTIMIADQTNSTALVANAWHHRSDAMSSIAVLLGAITLAFGWAYGDQSAGVIVGLMVSYAGLKIIFKALQELGEAAVDEKTREEIESIVKKQINVSSFHKLRARRSGHIILMDVHILVNPKLNVVQGHDVSKQVEQALKNGLGCPVDITVHVEPDIPVEQIIVE